MDEMTDLANSRPPLDGARQRQLHALIDQYARPSRPRRGRPGPELCSPSAKEIGQMRPRWEAIAAREGADAAREAERIQRRPRVIFDSLEAAQNFAAAAGQLFGEKQDAYLCPRSRHGHAHVKIAR